MTTHQFTIDRDDTDGAPVWLAFTRWGECCEQGDGTHRYVVEVDPDQIDAFDAALGADADVLAVHGLTIVSTPKG